MTAALAHSYPIYILLGALLCSTCASESTYMLVDLTSASNATRVAVNAAAGLMNRYSPAVFTIQSSYDVLWQGRLLPNATFNSVTPSAFIASSLGGFPIIVYNDSELYSLPAVMTLAGVMGAVPMEHSMWTNEFPNATVQFNAAGAWPNQAESLQFVSQLALNQTTSVAFQRPTDLVQGQLVDFIVGGRLFVQYLTEGCIPGTTEHMLLKDIVDSSPWPRPIRVYGYNGLDDLFGEDLFAAETGCVNTMGQVATEQATNLQFWTGISPIGPNETMQQRPAEPVVYNASKVYVALVYGDMDNIDFVQTFGSDHMEYRVQQCGGDRPLNASNRCFPLTWTLSPNLIQFSPQMMRWYFGMAHTTMRDWIIMPPSGTLYAYPGMMDNATQAQYVLDQTAQAAIMNTSGSVHWEWFFAWDVYFPRYTTLPAEVHTTRAFFLNDVPYVLPIPDMTLEGITYRFVGNASDPTSVVGLRPLFTWQEGAPGGGNTTQVAGMINNLATGSVQYLYVIQNSNMQSVFDLVSMLHDDVELLSYEQLVSAARQRETQQHSFS
ncbi:Hypothetical protein, putative [Bodo saltans]|uniref:GxGYxYP putative glycoside hydrolase C-terminal domain-containing protein n=1 Tax=Bodo saltans TaxID=75058 RepID=A0A0S4JAV6_BODSA|nr:Hypothetical protein, putative [Bodo saltans]|eukprot:CUG87333.1 Hypothetical protein, putative [Bodo saltans]